jgi:hypothetical protein
MPLGGAYFLELGGIDVLHDLGLLAEGLEERDLLGPGSHGGTLDGLIGILASHPAVSEFEQDGLTSPKPESEVHISLHVLGIDREIADESGQ